MKRAAVLSLAVLFALAFLTACAAALQNYEKVSLGMSKEEAKKIAGEPHRVVEVESNGEGPVINKAGKYEIWFYRHGVLVFSGDKLASKGHKVDTGW